MKNIYVILWVINSVIGTGLLSNELQEDENFLSFVNHNKYVKSCQACEKIQHHSRAFYDFDFEYGLFLNEKPLHPFVSAHIINIYYFIYTPLKTKLPFLYDLPPPDPMV